MTYPRRRPALTAAALLAGAALILVSRLHTYDLPTNTDIDLARVVGHELLQGRELYTEVWDHRPPLTYAAFAAAEAAVGWGHAQVLLVGTVLAVVTLLGVWSAGRAAGPLAGLVAAGFWVALQADVATEAQHPNGEAFLNACLVWGFALLARGRSRWGPAALWAAASLVKANAIVYPAAFALLRLGAAGDRRRAAADVGAWLAVGSTAWLGLAAWFAVQGRLHHFVQAVFAYPAYYSGAVWKSLVAGLFPSVAAPGILLGAVPAAALAAVALASPVDRSHRRLLAVALAATWLSVTLPGRFFAHYYQLYLPFLAVGAGWGAAALARRSRTAARAVVSLALLAVVAIQLPTYTLDGEAWVRRAMPGNADEVIARMRALPTVRSLLPDDGTLYVLGSRPGYWVAAHRSPPTGVLFLNHMCHDRPTGRNPVADRLTAMALSDLERRPPALVARDAEFGRLCPEHPIHDWVADRYVLRADLTRSHRAQILLPRPRPAGSP